MQTPDRSMLREVLGLSERLIAQPTVDARRKLIMETAARLVQGEADLWLAAEPRQLPGGDAPGVPRRALTSQLASSPAGPPSDLMRRALEAVGQSSTALCPAGVASTGRAVAVPMLAQDGLVGVLEVTRPGGPPFGDAEIELLECLAAQSVVALQAAQQVAIERWRVEQLSLVGRVSAQIADVVDLDELSRRVTELVLDTFSYYYVALFILEPDGEVLRLWASARQSGHARYEPGELSPPPEVQLGQGIIGQVAQTGAEILANDVGQEARYRYVDALPETRAEVALPLQIGGRVLGVLDVQSDQADAFDETDLLVLRALADQIAIAVEDARLYGDLCRRADQLSAVAEVGRAVVSILDLETLLEEVVELIHRQFGYPFVYLFTVDPVRAQIVYRAGIGPRVQGLRAEGVVCGLDESDGIVPWVACHGESVLANDVDCDPRCSPSGLRPSGSRAELAVPLVFGDDVLGVLDLHSDRRDAFTEEDRSLFEALAGSVAIAIRNASLYRSERWRRQVADSLREVAGILSANMALDQVLEAILIELERTLPCDVAAIWLLRGGNLCLSAVHGDIAEVCVSDISPDAGPWISQALSTDRPIIRFPQAPYEPLGAALGFPSDYSAISAPLRAGDRRLGILTLAHHTPGRYGVESQAMTAAFASHAAVAIENARLFQEAQEKARVSTVMLQVAKTTQALAALDQVLDAVVRLVPTLVGVERCAILMWDEASTSFVPAAAYGLSPAQQATFDQWSVAVGSEPVFDSLRLDQAPVFIYNVTTDSRLSGAVVWALGFESLLLLPLVAQDEVLGAMLVDYQSDWLEPGAPETLYDERLLVIQGIALQAAAAVENVRLREAQQQEAYVSAALLQVTQAVTSLNDLDDILGAIVRISPILVGVEQCVILLWDAEQGVFRLAQAYGLLHDVKADPMAGRYAPGDFPLLDAVREHGRLVAYPLGDPSRASDEEDKSGAEGAPSEWRRPKGEGAPSEWRRPKGEGAPSEWRRPKGEGAPSEWGRLNRSGVSPVPSSFVAALASGAPGDSPEETRSLLAFPLSVKGDVLGVMLVAWPAEAAETPRHLRQDTKSRRLEIITGVAHQAALAVQSDLLRQEMGERERMARELQLAHEIQQAFMPGQVPALPGWELAFAWRAARQVAGDFYDFFELPDGRLGMVIADVADKGMPAALFMALTRTLMRAAALEEKSPAAALACVNDLLVPDAHHGMFVTAIYATLSLDTGELIYANAGHNLPLLVRARTRQLEQFKKGGMALGVLEGVQSEEHVVRLEPGDHLVFYTDGITEAFSPEGELYGEGRLRTAIQSAGDSAAQAMLDAIERSVTAFAGDVPLSDDRTLMVLHRQF
jgi:sigma-B regulation protein RsbU (phosphoserine phosphatase)